MDIIAGIVALFIVIAVLRRGPRIRDMIRRWK